MRQQRYETISVELHHETENAWLVSTDGEEACAVWVPKSQGSIEHARGPIYDLTAPQWLLEAKGLV